jgi:uncharacterized repeat protein (TIGR04138 family)
MPETDDILCDVCGTRPATKFSYHPAPMRVRTPGGKWKIKEEESKTDGVRPAPAKEGVSTTTKLCRTCYRERATPAELEIDEAMANGCIYCGAPGASAGRGPEGVIDVKCRSCSSASREFMWKAYGLEFNQSQIKTKEDRSKAIRALTAKRLSMTPEVRAEKLAGIEDYLRGRRVYYAAKAYRFVRDMVRLQTGHVTAAVLLDVLRVSALEKFGSNAREQLREWGITRCEDFGEIVFRLVEEGMQGAEPGESREDFRGGYDFAVAFPEGE